MKLYPVRTSAKAIIINENKLLTIKHFQDGDVYYTLPGGGQNLNEDLKSALQRECLEEVGAEVEIGDIILVRDYIANNHEFADQDPDFHQVELMFICHILNPNQLKKPTELDSNQIGVEWISMNAIPTVALYPKILKEKLLAYYQHGKSEIYLGDIN